jgi:hypothetical protein
MFFYCQDISFILSSVENSQIVEVKDGLLVSFVVSSLVTWWICLENITLSTLYKNVHKLRFRILLKGLLRISNSINQGLSYYFCLMMEKS